MAKWTTLKTGTAKMANYATYFPIGLQYDDDSWQFDAATNRWSVLVDLYMTNKSTDSAGYYTSDSFSGSVLLGGVTVVSNGTIKGSSITQSTFYRSSGSTTRNGIRISFNAGVISSSIQGKVTPQASTTSNLDAALAVPTRLLNSTFGTINDFTMDGNANVGIPFLVPVTKNNVSASDTLTIKIGDIIVATRENYVSGNVTFSSYELDIIYGLIPTVNVIDFTFELRTYSGTTQLGSTQIKENIKGYISEIDRAPVLDSSQISYLDTNAITTAITGNSQKIIKGYSDLRININQEGQARKGATLGTNAYIFNSQNKNTQYANSGEKPLVTRTFTKQTGNNFSVSVIDSRGNQSNPAISKTVDLIPYTVPHFKNIIVERNNGVEQAVFITVDGVYENWSGLLYSNIILTSRYRYKEKGSSTWGSWQAISLTTNSGGVFARTRFGIGNFDVSKSYEFQFEVIDRLETSGAEPTPIALNAAEYSLMLDKINKTAASGMIPSSNLPKGAFQSAGGFYDKYGNAIGGFDINKVYPVGSIYMSVNSTNPSTVFGGTWSAWGAGRVPIGVGSNGTTNYPMSEATGGSESHTHTSAAHIHNIDSCVALVNTNSAAVDILGKSYNWTSGERANCSSYTGSGRANNWAVQTRGNTSSTTPGVTGSTNSLPPYVTCYMWMRTA